MFVGKKKVVTYDICKKMEFSPLSDRFIWEPWDTGHSSFKKAEKIFNEIYDDPDFAIVKKTEEVVHRGKRKR